MSMILWFSAATIHLHIVHYNHPYVCSVDNNRLGHYTKTRHMSAVSWPNFPRWLTFGLRFILLLSLVQMLLFRDNLDHFTCGTFVKHIHSLTTIDRRWMFQINSIIYDYFLYFSFFECLFESIGWWREREREIYSFNKHVHLECLPHSGRPIKYMMAGRVRHERH